ncbi:hypothetical protein [Mucilaginibacter ginsenosidivorans]|uniref:Uncharacterized protein n=1 Tax=Mucilaginibacter ginsenosidivorans TaxID=398053 RepID=A0A5B8USP4_9SPHI|nr:hypothetical protein [Mucilaginibacter ginsenosidivorans]QEC62127.1 hypothetical protein FRZ54_05860 [Mucilaginibacter ginsenosidivorans]
MIHSFHIPVLGLAFSIDTPIKVARYGISSVVSVVDDELVERMRKYHSGLNNIPYAPIHKTSPDCRARRITAYLNLLNTIVNDQFTRLKQEPFTEGSDIERYFDLLPERSVLKQGYDLMKEHEGERKEIFQQVLRAQIQKGSIDVNIMAKVDKLNYDAKGDYSGDENTDALAALRGFAESDLESSVVLSAGMNPKLYSYLEKFRDFYPDENGALRKKVTLKVSNYRSALIQAKFLAKKGIWVSEFRIESGLNCGGHAFATDGLLLGPILEEFKSERLAMQLELFAMYQSALQTKGLEINEAPTQRVTAQGGIGTGNEHNFLLQHYQLDAAGWGSPFLLVPEATNVDDDTLKHLAGSKRDDYYLSNASPLGVLFNNFKNSSIEQEKQHRIARNRPGSPCTKKYLCSNTEFTDKPICTASRQYQHLKIAELAALKLNDEDYNRQYESITEKVCLCEGLSASVYIKNDMLTAGERSAVAICPGPNLAYFSNVYSLDEMVSHIYGKINLLQGSDRSDIFINELNLYIDYLKREISAYMENMNDKKHKHLQNFKAQLQQGIQYYQQLIPQMTNYANSYIEKMFSDLALSEQQLCLVNIEAATNQLSLQ